MNCTREPGTSRISVEKRSESSPSFFQRRVCSLPETNTRRPLWACLSNISISPSWKRHDAVPLGLVDLLAGAACLSFPNAGCSAEEADLRDVVITHPFHPLRGQAVRVYDRVGGYKRAIVRYFADAPPGATLVSAPVSWTSLRKVDDFERVAAGRCLFRGDDLIVLRELVDTLLAPPVERNQK